MEQIDHMKKLNVGCGNRILPGYVNIDIVQGPGVDVVHDLNEFPYPFKDNEFDVIYADNVIEHVDNCIAVIE
jgi:predicted SAM-dependent methyltransferase